MPSEALFDVSHVKADVSQKMGDMEDSIKLDDDDLLSTTGNSVVDMAVSVRSWIPSPSGFD